MNRVHETALWRALSRAADLLLVATLTYLASLPVITAPAAVAAGSAALSADSLAGSWGAFWATFRCTMSTGVRWGSIGALAVVVAAANVIFLAPSLPALPRSLAAVGSIVVIIAAAGVLPYLALILGTADARFSDGFRAVPALVALAPRAFGEATLLAAVGAAVALVFPIGLIVIAGIVAILPRRIAAHIERTVIPT